MLRKQTIVYVLASFLNTCFDVSKVLMPWLRTIEKRVRGQSLEGITDNPHPYQFREAKTKKNNMKNDAFIVDLNADIIIRSK